MIQFENATFLWLGILISLGVLAMNLFTLKRVKFFKRRDIARTFMWSLALLFLGAALGGIKAEWEKPTPVMEKMEIIFALDGSLSSLAQDVFIEENNERRKICRLEFAKQLAEKTAGKLDSDTVGIIVFADQAIPLQIALAREDYKNTFLRNLKYVDKEYIRSAVKQGTDYGNLIMAALEQFDEESGNKKLLIILTDGEPQGNEEKLEQNLIKALDIFLKRKDEVIIHLIGIGDTKQPSPIPKSEDENGNPKEYYVHENGDSKGQQILTRPNPEFLAHLANATGGHYFYSDDSREFDKAIQNTIQNERRIAGWKKVKETVELRPYLLAGSLILLFAIPIIKSV